MLQAFAHLAAPVYNTMQGPSEFTITGNLKAWDRWADLPQLAMPTLLLVNRHDTIAMGDIERMRSLIPHSRVVVCKNGSHMSLYDDQEAYFKALVPFLHKAHEGTFRT